MFNDRRIAELERKVNSLERRIESLSNVDRPKVYWIREAKKWTDWNWEQGEIDVRAALVSLLNDLGYKYFAQEPTLMRDKSAK